MENKMASGKVNGLIWKMGLPMILSMILQAIYNVIDTIYVVNEPGLATNGNLALTYAFPIQIVIIAIGVGTGVGMNAMLSKCLGQGDKENVNRIAGNGIFLMLVIYAIFLLFGLSLAEPFIKMMASSIKDSANYDTVVEMGSSYLKICCVFSIGSIGFAVYERFLQATGKTTLSTIAQVAGAASNIVLDYVFIYPCQMGVAGAAIATVIGQVLSLLLAMILHYCCNKEINGHPKYMKPNGKIILSIYKIGLPAVIMQLLLAIMMLTCVKVIGTISDVTTLATLQGAFGIYYKIMQIALFASFGLSNTLITLVAFTCGINSQERVNAIIKFGIIDSVIVTGIITILFQVLAGPISSLFAMTLEDGDKEAIISVCKYAMHIATIGYVFMGVSVAIQGVLQGYRKVISPLVISFLRLIVFVAPVLYLFTLTSDPSMNIWWTFPIAEFLTAMISVIILIFTQKKIKSSQNKEVNASAEGK